MQVQFRRLVAQGHPRAKDFHLRFLEVRPRLHLCEPPKEGMNVLAVGLFAEVVFESRRHRSLQPLQDLRAWLDHYGTESWFPSCSISQLHSGKQLLIAVELVLPVAVDRSET